MRIYISGPISGVDNFRYRFANAQMWLEEKYKPEFCINPAANNEAIESVDYERIMGVSLALVEVCDTIYLLRGWERSLGCRQEYGYAMAKGMRVIKECDGD